MKPLLVMKNVYKTFFKKTEANPIIKGINATFKGGHSYAITGVSGCGKSTLLNVLAGFERPTAGQVVMVHEIFSSPSCHHFVLQEFVGVVLQSPYLIQELTIIENVMLKGLIAGKPTKESYKNAYELLEYVELAHYAHEAPSVLSGGQQQRVSLARALFNKPLFLLADEPTGNLDYKTGQHIINLLLKCKEEWGMGIIVSSHDNALANAMDIVMHIDQGILT